MNTTFIRSSDPSTIKRLKELGYIVLSEDGKFVTFLNDPSKMKNFSKNEKLVFTNKMEL